MTEFAPPDDHPNEAMWRDVLLHGHRGRFAFLPADPRCMVCQQPFEGLGGLALRALIGYGRSYNSPNVCNMCEVHMPVGGAEVDTAILFADIRGSTALAERLGAAEYARLVDRFYRESSHALVAAQSWIDKFVGDEIMAIHIPAMGPDYRARAVRAGLALLDVAGYRPGATPWLPLAVGIHAGPAVVGKFGTDAVKAITALGDTVNAAARIQAQAAAGELLVSEELYRSVAAEHPGLERRTLELRGREGTMDVRVFRPAGAGA